MIEVDKTRRARYWGKFDVVKVAKLSKPVQCFSEEVGEVLFNPVLAYIMWWHKAPCSDDPNCLWFPYWVTIKGKEKYGQFAPMIGEKALLQLLLEAIKQDFFSKSFLRELNSNITKHLQGKWQATKLQLT